MVGQGLADSTICKRCGDAKTFLNHAVDKERIPSNPFARLKSTA